LRCGPEFARERELTSRSESCLLVGDTGRCGNGERAMRIALWRAMAFCAVAILGALPAMARDYPFCIKGCDFGAGRGECSFSSYQQCQATASGRDATCAENPYYSAKAELAPDRNRLSRRRY